MNSNMSISYGSRLERNKFFVSHFLDKNYKEVLNLGGGGKRHLEASLGDFSPKVIEVDLAGDCDLLLNLDEMKSLPFPENSFDVVCAFDVLEHLENFHFVVSEMFRVSRNKVVCSLPIGFIEIFDLILKREKNSSLEHGVYSKYYGLPIQPPSDRHRWFLTHDDIERFFVDFSLKNGAEVKFFPRNNKSIRHKVLRLVLPNHIYRNIFCPYLWVEIKKTSESDHHNNS